MSCPHLHESVHLEVRSFQNVLPERVHMVPLGLHHLIVLLISTSELLDSGGPHSLKLLHLKIQGIIGMLRGGWVGTTRRVRKQYNWKSQSTLGNSREVVVVNFFKKPILHAEKTTKVRKTFRVFVIFFLNSFCTSAPFL